MYDARAIANLVLERAWDLGHELTQIDIQKICYFLHGHYLQTHGRPLVATEFEAWEYGPVQRALYGAFKRFEGEPITMLAVAFDPIRRRNVELPHISDNSVIDTIEKYLPYYLEIPSFELVNMTHRPGTPWSRTIADAETHVNVGMRIDNATIRSHFEGIVAA